MTKPTIAPTELVENGADADLLKQVIQFVAQRMMEFDVKGLRGTGFDVKSPDRVNSRNGYRDRLWQTRAGDVDLKIPKLRRTATSCREADDSGHSGGLHPGRIDALGGRTGQGDGHVRHLEEPGFTACRRDR